MGMIDFAPLFRSTVGYDRLPDLLDGARRHEQADTYPPYNIEKISDDEYRIAMAVAGFAPGEITLTAQPNLLVVEGRRQNQDSVQYLHHGLPLCAFERRFNLADYVQVKGATLENGLLCVDLAREIPEARKPRTIQISTTSPPNHIEADQDGTRKVA
jgi:molecular chaperone IbpA